MRISVPGVLPTTSAIRAASAPNFAAIRMGSRLLPSDFDILCPCASRTSPWRYTVLKGIEPSVNSVSVPDLSADAPVAQIFYPVEIGLLKMFGDNFNSPRTHWLKHQLFERLATSGDFFVHLDEPLQFYLRLDNATRALGSGDVVDVRLLFGHEAFRVELLDDFRSGLGDFRPRQFS